MPACLLIAGGALLWPEAMTATFVGFTKSVYDTLGGFLLLSVSAFLLLCLVLACGPWGRVRLGGDDERPEHSTLSWLAMLFAAGIGSGLLFWGVAEPLTHHLAPPRGAPGTAATAREALLVTNYHWGLHAWGCYGLSALVLAYFQYRHGTTALASSPLRHSFRGRWIVPVATVADVVAIFAVVFGTAAAMMTGTLQLRAGIARLLGQDPGTPMLLAIAAALALTSILSAVSGIGRGIKLLSSLNIILASLLLISVLLLAQTGDLLAGFIAQIADYIVHLPQLTIAAHPYLDVIPWRRSWSLPYFMWWIAWAPFVGVFIASISRGRTIRGFVLGVILAPTAISALWFAVFGRAGIAAYEGGADELATVIRTDAAATLFELLAHLPATTALSILAVALMFFFLVTSLDSATYVLAMLAQGGERTPARSRRIAWGLGLGLLATALLFTSTIDTIKAIAVLGAIPFVFILWLQALALVRALWRDRRGADDASSDDVVAPHTR